MRLRRRPSPLLLLLLPCVSLALPPSTQDEVIALAEGRQLPKEDRILEATPSVPVSPSLKPTSSPGLRPKDAPIDGKDGRPHTGPFVETAAERDRKKAKESGNEEDLPAVGSKPIPVEIPKGASYSDGREMPKSNDGVMDDPNRVGPKDGTRGTEGGISEKNRDRIAQSGQSGYKSGKQPDQPKEAPPLPHSEQEKLETKEGKGKDAPSKDGALEEEDKPKELGGLEVIMQPCPSTAFEGCGYSQANTLSLTETVRFTR